MRRGIDSYGKNILVGAGEGARYVELAYEQNLKNISAKHLLLWRLVYTGAVPCRCGKIILAKGPGLSELP